MANSVEVKWRRQNRSRKKNSEWNRTRKKKWDSENRRRWRAWTVIILMKKNVITRSVIFFNLKNLLIYFSAFFQFYWRITLYSFACTTWWCGYMCILRNDHHDNISLTTHHHQWFYIFKDCFSICAWVSSLVNVYLKITAVITEMIGKIV